MTKKNGIFTRSVNKIKTYFNKMGPGITSGAADDDPSGIATCAQSGAQFGYSQLWTPVFMLPLMFSIQEASARIGAVKGKGLIYIISYYYGKKLSYFMMILLIIANTINIGADIGSMVEATRLIIPLNFTVLICMFIAFISLSQIAVGYKKYSHFLKWLSLFALAYPLTVLITNPPYFDILKYSFIPQIQYSNDFFYILTGLFGTTISPYLFFWQASQEVEEDHDKHLISHDKRTRIKKIHIFNIRLDTFVGMFISQFTTWAIIVVAATNLHKNNTMKVDTAQQAAAMLKPLVNNFSHAGFITEFIFAAGIVGLGLLAVPVLAASASYTICESLTLKKGFNLKVKSAKVFYLSMFLCMAIGALINYIGIKPMNMLVVSAVINCILALPLIFLIAIIGRNEKIMGKNRNGLLSQTFIWTTFTLMLISTLGMFISFSSRLFTNYHAPLLH